MGIVWICFFVRGTRRLRTWFFQWITSACFSLALSNWFWSEVISIYPSLYLSKLIGTRQGYLCSFSICPISLYPLSWELESSSRVRLILQKVRTYIISCSRSGSCRGNRNPINFQRAFHSYTAAKIAGIPAVKLVQSANKGCPNAVKTLALHSTLLGYPATWYNFEVYFNIKNKQFTILLHSRNLWEVDFSMKISFGENLTSRIFHWKKSCQTG